MSMSQYGPPHSGWHPRSCSGSACAKGATPSFQSRIPSQARAFRKRLLSSEVPVVGGSLPFHVAVEKEEIRPTAVRIRVSIPFRRHRRELSVLKQPHQRRRFWNRRGRCRPGLLAGSIDPSVEGIVEQHAPIAPARVRRTEPNRLRQCRRWIGSPASLLMIGLQTHGTGQVHIPGIPCGDPVGRPIVGQSVRVVREVDEGCGAPLAEM